MKDIRIIFFGSTSDSVLVLEKLITHPSSLITARMCAVVTQPPRPVGRKRILTPTPVDVWAKKHTIAVLSFPSDPHKPWLYANEAQVVDALQPLKADLLVSACYGQKIPIAAIRASRYGGLNVHPSLLPRWRGADPVPWAILAGDRQTGVTIVTLSEKFDEGTIVAQKKIPITQNDTNEALRTKLFTIGAGLLAQTLVSYIEGVKPGKTSPKSKPLSSQAAKLSSYARRLTRDDGFEPWDTIQKAFEDREEAKRIERKFRALTPWPGLWTKIRVGKGKLGITEEKRLKILGLSLIADRLPAGKASLSLDAVQLEGKNPVPFSQFAAGYL